MPYISKLYDDTTRDLGWKFQDRIRSIAKDTCEKHLPVSLAKGREHALFYISRDHTINTFFSEVQMPEFLQETTLKEAFLMMYSEERRRYEGKYVISPEDFDKNLLDILESRDGKLFLEFA